MTAAKPAFPWRGIFPAAWLAAIATAVFYGGVNFPGAVAQETRPRSKPRLVPLPAEVPSPPDNPTTPAKVALGRRLFFDPRLSGNNAMSCATCHLPQSALADGLPRARGAGEKLLARNTPTLWNVGFHQALFWDGRAKSLEQQALLPITSPEEMHQDLNDLEGELAAIPGYAGEFQSVFGAGVSRQRIAQALAAFQRTLVSGPAPFDRYLAGDPSALSNLAKEGLRLFTGEAGCVRCHHGPLLSDEKYYRLGTSFRDAGRAAVTGKDEDRYKFRTPGLRNVARTGPYMHDGSLRTLDDVVTFYYRGVPAAGPKGEPLDVQVLSDRSFSEIPALVAFLESLSGELPPVEPPDHHNP